MHRGQRSLIQKISATALAAALFTGTVACSSEPSPVVLGPDEQQTVTVTSESSGSDALLEGVLGSVTEDDKVYFYITDEDEVTWGLVLPKGYTSHSDGQMIWFKGAGRSSVGNQTGAGGGVLREPDGSTAAPELADLWDAKFEVDGLWLAASVGMVPLE